MTLLEDLKLCEPDWSAVSVIGKVARVFVRNEIGIVGSRAADVLSNLADCSEIHLHIADCLGGDCSVALELYQGLVGRHVEVTISGKCYSAAAIIAMAGCKIRMRHNAEILIHSPKSVVFGGVREMEEAQDRIVKDYARILRIFTTRTGTGCDVVDTWLSKDTFFNAAAALEANLVDEIIQPPPPAPIVESQEEDPPRVETHPKPRPLLPSDDEVFFWAMIQAMGEGFTVRSKADFARELNAWLTMRVRE